MANVLNNPALAVIVSNAQVRAEQYLGAVGLNSIIGKHVLPPLPPYPTGVPVHVHQIPESESENSTASETPAYTIFGTPMCFPLWVKLKSQTEDDWWLLPTEPIITISGTNILVRRSVAKKKSRGKISESWAQDDYTINIDGLLTRIVDENYPQDDVSRMRKIMEAREPIDVKCQLFEILGIGRIIIERYDWPFTKGENNQAYRIAAYSDDDWDLFIKVNK